MEDVISKLKLHQFSSSHFNEKARWALDFKGLQHDRLSYLPGPHMPAIKKLTGGKTSTTPVLEDSNRHEVVQGSDKIIDYLETQFPETSLYPEDPNEALEWQKRLDAELGPAVRTVVFEALVEEPGHLTQTFAGTKPFIKRSAYRLLLPFVLPLIKKANGVNEQNIKRSKITTAQFLDEIESTIAHTGYIVGDKFSIADLTAAALLAPIANVDHPDMKRPKPIPERLKSLLGHYGQHPTIAWVNKIYQQHR